MHIEVRGLHRDDRAEIARAVERGLGALRGVDWAGVNEVLGRAVVAFDAEEIAPSDLVLAVEAVEAGLGVDEEGFPGDRPEHPGDVEPLRQQMWAMGADVVAGMAALIRPFRTTFVSAEVAALAGLVQATPPLREPLEKALGPIADVGLGSAHAAAQALGGSPLSVFVDAAYRALLLREMTERRAVWERRESELHDKATAAIEGIDVPRRPRPLAAGRAERYARRSAAAAFAGAVITLATTRDPRLAVAATVAGNPRAATIGGDSFAAVLGRLLAERGVLPIESGALRRLDAIDTVVLDADVLLTGSSALGSTWIPHGRPADQDDLWLMSPMLFESEDPDGLQESGTWTLGPAGAPDLADDTDALRARRVLNRGSRGVLALRDNGELAALVAVEPQLDPLARVLAKAAGEAGALLVAGVHAGAAERLGAAATVKGGTALAAEVRALQEDGHVVAVVSARQHAALAAADVGIGVPRHSDRPPWGADLITSRGLLDAWLILQAVPVARSVARRSVMTAAYGAGAAGLLALAGPRRGATARAALAANGATAVSCAAGAWSARALGRVPEPIGEDSTEWHAITREEVLARLGSRSEGLAQVEAELRAPADGNGEAEREMLDVLRATLDELGNPLTPALATGAGLSAGLGSVIDAGLIGSAMGLNAFIGGIQRVGADRALRRLLDAGVAHVPVRRDGVEIVMRSDQLVPGDVLVLRAGDSVPADCRILETRGIEVDESSVTGESQTVAKDAEPTAAPAVADRHSMLYAGTWIAAGEAVAIVVATGDATEMARSARHDVAPRRPSGVEQRLRQLTAKTLPIALGAGAALIGGGLLRGRPLSESLTTGVGLAVAAVPEGLPIVATVAQLASARRLSGRNALVRHSSTIEALGRVDVLCADKTGTLTTGQITLRYVSDGGAARQVHELADEQRLVLAAALRATPPSRNGEALAHPTDRAVIDGAVRADVDAGLGAEGWRMERELPFEPGRGFHAVLGVVGDRRSLAVKGSPEGVLPRCRRWRTDGRSVAFGDEAQATVQAEVDRLAQQGYRVLAVAERSAKNPGDLHDARVARLELLGLVAMADPVRPAAADSVAALLDAGVAVRMITGDHPSTAESIAAELGLLSGGDGEVVTGPELDRMTDEQLSERIDSVAVFARVSPAQKVRIVGALQSGGHVVAMTGDGANDAAAIRLADVGVALGAKATTAAKDAADVVVTDDRIETIIDAILEGRAMWASVRDAVSVLVGGNLGEIMFTLGAGMLLPGGSPLNARQLLLVNLLTDLVPAMALAVRPPAGTDPAQLAAEGPEASLGSALTRDVIVRGAVTAAAGGVGWQAGRMTGVTRGRASTIALVSIVGSQLGQTLAAGWRNPLVAGSTVLSGAALAAVVQTPGLSHFFGCRPLGPVGWAIGASSAAGSCVAAPLAHQVLDRLAPRAAR
jgi:cation-transporting P-type ATPase I